MKKNFYLKNRQRTPLFFVVLFFVFSAVQGVAQPAAESLRVKLSEQSDENQQLSELYYGAHASVYVAEGAIEKYGESTPVTAAVEPESFSLLSAGNELFGSIKLLIIKVSSAEQLAGSLNLGQLPGFASLEYVVVVFEYDACGGQNENCLAGQVQNVVTNPGDLPVYYLLSIPK